MSLCFSCDLCSRGSQCALSGAGRFLVHLFAPLAEMLALIFFEQLMLIRVPFFSALGELLCLVVRLSWPAAVRCSSSGPGWCCFLGARLGVRCGWVVLFFWRPARRSLWLCFWLRSKVLSGKLFRVVGAFAWCSVIMCSCCNVCLSCHLQCLLFVCCVVLVVCAPLYLLPACVCVFIMVHCALLSFVLCDCVRTFLSTRAPLACICISCDSVVPLVLCPVFDMCLQIHLMCCLAFWLFFQQPSSPRLFSPRACPLCG